MATARGDMERVLRVIEAERDRANLTDRELERLAGLGKGTLSRIFARQVTPSVETLQALADALGHSLLALISLAEGSSGQADEHDLLKMFREMDQPARRLFLGIARSMAEKAGKDK